MPRRMNLPALAAAFLMAAELLMGAGCTTPANYRLYPPIGPSPTQGQAPEAPTDAQLARFASAMAMDLPDSGLLAAAPGTCGQASAPVVHVVFPEQVLFATASDEPGPNASAALDDIAGRIRQEAPGAELTVLGHTDAVGSDAYNMDLSKRRAVTVLRGLVARGLDQKRLSVVAIGKRQPIADNSTPEGRAQNRRVEFLVSRCLTANLGVVAGIARDRALLTPGDDASRPIEVMRLDPAGAYGLAPIATITLKPPAGDQPRPATVQTSNPVQPSSVHPPVGVARPAPAPHFQPRTLSPDVQRNPLGPAVSF